MGQNQETKVKTHRGKHWYSWARKVACQQGHCVHEQVGEDRGAPLFHSWGVVEEQTHPEPLQHEGRCCMGGTWEEVPGYIEGVE